jgi:hypothetical protein
VHGLCFIRRSESLSKKLKTPISNFLAVCGNPLLSINQVIYATAVAAGSRMLTFLLPIYQSI